jgi:hypothetical protein
MSVGLGLSLGAARLSRRTPWVLFGMGVLLVLCVGALERMSEPAYALDRALLGVAFGLALPLFCYLVFESVLAERGLPGLVLPLQRHGADARTLSFGIVMALTAVCAAAGVVFSLGALLVTVGFGPAFSRELLPCIWGGAAAGFAYAGLFAFASRFRRLGRLSVLFGDWLLGAGSGVLALPFPRGHVRSLFGGDAVLDLSQLDALAFLVLIAFAGTLASAAFGRH